MEITPEKLLEDLNYIQKNIDTIQGKRLLVLCLDLYAGHFIGKLYDEKIKELEKQGIDINSIKKVEQLKVKATHLVAWGTIEKRYFEPISLIHHLRCNLVHNLEPNLEKLEDKIDELIPDMDDTSGFVSKFLEKADAWEKIQAYTFPTIYYLYKCLKEFIGEKNEYMLEFDINKDTLIMTAKLTKII